MADLMGKVAVILGVSSVIVGIAQRLADSGAEIIFCRDTSQPQMTTLAKHIVGSGGAAREQPVNLNDPAALAAQIGALGPVHIAVILPGWHVELPFMETPIDIWDSLLNQHTEQAVYAAQTVARRMIEQGKGGRIIVLSSVAGLRPLKNMSALGTSLAALHAVAKMAAVDLAPYRITVNVVAIGKVDTGWTSYFPNPSGEALTLPSIPSGRAATLDEIGDLVCFLASKQAEYITGAIIPIDGGYLLTKSGAGTTSPSRD